MNIRRPLWLWSAPAWPNGSERAPRTPIILLYHSVAKVRTDPWGVRVKPRNFMEQMMVLKAHCRVMRLADLDQALSAGEIPPRAVVVTFDDGYVDNLLHAKPAMQRCGVPGTVFVSSGYMDQRDEYWWDEIDRLILQPGTLPREIEIAVAGRTLSWKLGDAADYGPIRAWRDRHWFAWQEPRNPRQRMFLEFWEALRSAPSVAQREDAIEQLRRLAGASRDGRSTHRCCSGAQARELAAGGLIEIGAHTVHHPSLGHLPVTEQRREVFDSKAALEATLQVQVQSFSYPFGARIDYTPDTIALLKEAGYRQACSNFPAPLTASVDRFQYPRRVVMDWDGREFARRLAGWFADDARASVAAFKPETKTSLRV